MDYWSIAISLLGLAAGLGAAFIRFRSEADNESARLWRDNAEAEKARAERLEGVISDLTARVERLENENALLRGLVTGERAMRALSTLVTDQHAEVLAALRALRGPVRPVETRAAQEAATNDNGPS
ncbi:hypothetical protein ACFY2K_26215 [Kitasatospora sp. NPDC001309]|uniref:hypothetical protein n=1 Tax=Kitasatospora sp. NPDC001309 TaxID=3364013 RepID=UPI0036901D8D